MRLRYTGQLPVSFMGLPYLGEVEPGEFEARDSDAEALLTRRDIEPAGDATLPQEPLVEGAAASKARKTAASKSAEAPAADPSTTTA